MSACSAAAASRALRPAAQPRTAGMHRRGCSSRSSLPAPDGRRLTAGSGRARGGGAVPRLVPEDEKPGIPGRLTAGQHDQAAGQKAREQAGDREDHSA
jgi:hypothetical protein